MLRRSCNEAIVSVEFRGKWVDVIEENVDGSFSHIVEPSGILRRASLDAGRPRAEGEGK